MFGTQLVLHAVGMPCYFTQNDRNKKLKLTGGRNSDGCGRVLTRDKYLDHDSEPYCPACYNKLFRPKGYGFGTTLSTDYGPIDSSLEENKANSASNLAENTIGDKFSSLPRSPPRSPRSGTGSQSKVFSSGFDLTFSL